MKEHKPCSPGCHNHVTHPCKKCRYIAGEYSIDEQSIFWEGKDIKNLSREQLISIIEYLSLCIEENKWQENDKRTFSVPFMPDNPSDGMEVIDGA